MYDNEASHKWLTVDDLDIHSEPSESKFCRQKAEHVGHWFNYFSKNIEDGRNDLYFLFIDQWTPADRQYRVAAQKPIMQFNYLMPLYLQLLGEQRQNDIGIVVRAKNTNVPTKEVTKWEDAIRHIFYENDIDVIAQEGFKYALSAGYGALHIYIDYESPESMTKRIYIRNLDWSSCFWDLNAKEVHKGDGRYCGFITDMPKDEFHAKYPNATSDVSFQGLLKDQLFFNYWYVEDCIRIADYWQKEEYNETICRLSDGTDHPLDEAQEIIASDKKKRSTILKAIALQQTQAQQSPQVPQAAQMPPQQQQQYGMSQAGNQSAVPSAAPSNPLTSQPSPQSNVPSLPPPLEIVSKRKTKTYRIMHYRMIFNEILEVEQWESQFLPVVFIDCDSTYVDKLQMTRSFFRTAQDSQRFLNHLRSEACEALMNTHQTQFLVTPDQVRGHEKTWNNPQRSKSGLIFTPDEKVQGGAPIPINPPSISQSYDTQTMQTISDIKNITGRYDATQGAPGNEASGIAIKSRQAAGNLSSFVPFDNLRRALDRIAKICMNVLPNLFQENRLTPIRKRDGKVEMAHLAKNADYHHFMPSFDVTIEIGASFAVQQQLAFEQMSALIQACPPIAQLIPDLLAANMDLDNVNQIVDRLKTLVPPQVLAQEEGKPMPPQPQQPDPNAMQMQLKQQELQLKQQQMQISAQENEKKMQLADHKLHIQQQNDNNRNRVEQQKMQLNANDAQQRNMIDVGKMTAEIDKAKLDHLGKMNIATLNHLSKTQSK